MRRLLHALLLSALCQPALAAAPDDPPPPPQSPPQSLPPSGEEELHPEVTIRHHKEKTVEEYRIGGQLYMIKVIPKVGKPYYLVDSDGNGSLDMRQDELEPRLLVPTWVIFRW